MTVSARAYEEGLKLSGRGEHALAIGRYEQALAEAPNDTRVLFALGNTARALGMPRPAEAFFRRVLAQEPQRLEALINLANLLRSQGNFISAEALLAPALARDPDRAELWLTLGSVYRETGDHVRATEYYREALARDPNYPQALGNLADLLADDGDVDGALALYERVLKRDRDNAQARMNRAVLHLLRGNLKDGWSDYAARLKLAGKVPVPDHKLPRWNGNSLKRQRLLVTAEQGVGDQIMFASVVPDLATRAAGEGASVILECEPRLVSLFARSFPSVAVRAWDSETRGGVPLTRYGWLKAAGGATSAVEMGTLPRYLRSTIRSFPSTNAYLVPDAGRSDPLARSFSAPPSVSAGAVARPAVIGRCNTRRSKPGPRFCATGPAPLSRFNTMRRRKKSNGWNSSAAARSSCRKTSIRKTNWIAPVRCFPRWTP